MTNPTTTIAILRRELRASMGDRGKLSKLHSTLTDTINRSYGEEKAALVKFRDEVKEALNCRVDNW